MKKLLLKIFYKERDFLYIVQNQKIRELKFRNLKSFFQTRHLYKGSEIQN